MREFINKHRWDIAFWTVQVLGWGGMVFIAYAFTPNTDGYKETSFFLYSLWISFAIGLFCTGLLRAYLKRKISLDSFDGKQLLKISIAIALTSLLYGGLSYATGFLKGYFDPEEVKIPEMYKDFGIGLMMVNSIITIFGWTVFYMAVKIAFKLNSDRVERAELNATLRQAQLNTLKGQINPHFMFNSLNNIRGLMLEDVERSREMLTKLSEMLRYSLMKNDINAIPLEEELEMMDNYIALSKIQMEDRLNFVRNIDKKTLTVPIPPMIIQLLIENAAKHGISRLKEGGTITLTTMIEKEALFIEVANTGKLQMDKNSTQLGLKNIRQRLRLLYGNKATFALEETDGGVTANIKIPMV